MKSVHKEYSNGEVTIVWKNELCIHSTICWKHATGLPEVFNPKERPWIKPQSCSTELLIEQVKKCPSGALSYFLNDHPAEELSPSSKPDTIIEIMPNGPLLVHGLLTIKDQNGNETQKSKLTALCRCGASANKPYCDGSHNKIDFKD